MARNEPTSDARKQSLYLPTDMLAELRAVAEQQERSLSWLVQTAWKLARKEIIGLRGTPPGAKKAPRKTKR